MPLSFKFRQGVWSLNNIGGARRKGFYKYRDRNFHLESAR
ncbi:hypothetical protein AAUPMG_06177, partial [Pasteurella multocida subsp. multocida str. Anand1_goat]